MSTHELPKLKPAPALPPAQEGSPIQNIPVGKIVRSPWNRQSEPSADLVASISKYGVLENLVLRPIKASMDLCTAELPHAPFSLGETIYQLVAGERRWKAAKKAGRTHVPASIRNLTDIEAMELQVEENEQRKDYSPLEKAEAYDALRHQYMEAHKGEKGFTAESAIELVAKSRQCEPRTVYEIISVKTKLHDFVKAALKQDEMLASHAYAIAPRSHEEQLALLKWLRTETQHSQGDIPSVRRLKREIHAMDIAADEKRRQEKLSKDPQPGTSSTPVPTVNDQLYAKAVDVVREMHLHRMNDPLFLQRNLKIEPNVSQALFARMEKEGIVTPCDSHSERSYIFPKPLKTSANELIYRLHTNTLTPEDEKKLQPPKPLTPAQLKKEAEAAAERDREFKRNQDKFERDQRINKRFQSLFFAALAKKAQINSRLLSHIIPNMIFEVWENELEVWENELPIEAFAQDVLQWPAPKSGEYAIEEVRSHSAKHTRKFTPGLLAAMVLTLYLNEAETQKIARYIGIDPKKVRKQAASAIAEEEKDEKKKGKA